MKEGFWGIGIGIEIDEQYIKIAHIGFDNDYKYAKYELTSGAVVQGELINTEPIEEILRKHIRDNSIKSRNAALIIKSPQIITRHIKIPNISEMEIYRYILSNQGEYLPSGTPYIFDYRVCGKNPETKSILLAAIPLSIADGYVRMLHGLGLRVVLADAYFNCISRAFDFLENEGSIIFSMEKNTLHVTAAAGSDVILYDQFDPSGDLSEDINSFLCRYLLNTDIKIKKAFTTGDDYELFERLNLNFEYIKPSCFYALHGLMQGHRRRGFLPDWYIGKLRCMFVIKSMYIFFGAFLVLLAAAFITVNQAAKVYESETLKNSIVIKDEKYALSDSIAQELQAKEEIYEQIRAAGQSLHKESIITDELMDRIFSLLPENVYIVSIDFLAELNTVTVTGVTGDKKLIPQFTSGLLSIPSVKKVTLLDISNGDKDEFNYSVQLIIDD